MTLKAFLIVVGLAAFLTYAVIWISKNGGWKSEEGCHGDCAACHSRCDEIVALRKVRADKAKELAEEAARIHEESLGH